MLKRNNSQCHELSMSHVYSSWVREVRSKEKVYVGQIWVWIVCLAAETVLTREL